MNALVSILVPIYNVQDYIERCAKSLFEQTYSNIEYVFVNDCSQDHSDSHLNSIIKEYSHLKNRIKIIYHEANKGLAASRMTGINNASGDYLMFVDSDDYLEPNCVQLLIEKAEEGSYDIVSAGIRHVFTGKSFVVMPPQDIDRDKYLRLILEGRVPHNTVSRVFKRGLFIDNKGLFVEGINSGEDYLMISRIFSITKNIAFVNSPLYNYIHTNPTSITSFFSKKNLEQQLMAEHIVRQFYEQKGQISFLEAQIRGCLKNKAQNIISLLLHDYNISDYEYVKKLYLTDEPHYLSSIPFQYRLVLRLSKILDDKLLSKVVKLGYTVKSLYNRKKS